ncbi:hypothetical protein [Woodsholea maritima]|uniref:hypothetical protein n=1 Tax=Woodsholea maritima TaxID=240237 RepID=UPI000360CF41|nr:hypothetical protein [Woodsholea maritima]
MSVTALLSLSAALMIQSDAPTPRAQDIEKIIWAASECYLGCLQEPKVVTRDLEVHRGLAGEDIGISITREEWDEITQAIAAADFFTFPGAIAPGSEGCDSFDFSGPFYALEVRAGHVSHGVSYVEACGHSQMDALIAQIETIAPQLSQSTQ